MMQNSLTKTAETEKITEKLQKNLKKGLTKCRGGIMASQRGTAVDGPARLKKFSYGGKKTMKKILALTLAAVMTDDGSKEHPDTGR